MNERRPKWPDLYLYPWNFYLLVHIGKLEEAMMIFEEKIKLRFGQIINYKLDPFLEPIRLHEKYSSIIDILSLYNYAL